MALDRHASRQASSQAGGHSRGGGGEGGGRRQINLYIILITLIVKHDYYK